MVCLRWLTLRGRGPLACNVIGDVRRANQFYNRARLKVAPFFDTSDYTVAESLATMAYFAFGQVGTAPGGHRSH